jgi:hypothetical protein
MPQAMTGGGDYDRHSEHQQRDAAAHADLVAQAADRIAVDPASGAVVLADYGCAQGRSSNVLLRTAVERIRAQHPDVPISVVHNDLLSNDWETLIDHLRAPGSYLDVPGGPITPTISAISFYEPVVPRGLVDLGLSFAALQWLAEPGPGNTGSALYFDQLEGAARAAISAQAHADWTRFLERRTDELAAGGRMVVDMMGVPDDGTAAGHDAWRLVRSIAEDLVAEDLLDAARLDDYVLPVYERTFEELRRPFGEAIGRRLVLEHVAMSSSASPAEERYRQTGDATTFARQFVGFFRAFSEPSLRAALDPSGSATDELYRRMESELAAQVDGFDFTIHVLTAVIANAVS